MKTKLLTLTLITLIIGSLVCIAVPQTQAAVGPITGFHIGFLQSSFTVAMSNSIIIVAKDADNNTVTSYSGTVTLTCTDPKAILPTNTAIELANGIASRTVYLGTAGDQTFTVTDNADNTLTGSAAVTATPIHFSINVTPTSIIVGESVNVTVTALDAQDNVLTMLGNQGYGAGIEFSSTDTAAEFPAQGNPSALVSGTRIFNITLNTVGSQTITATNRDFNLIKATTTTITVNPEPSPTPVPSPTPTPAASSSPTASPSVTVAPTEQAQPLTAADNSLTLIIVAIVVVIVIVAVVLLVLKKKGAF